MCNAATGGSANGCYLTRSTAPLDLFYAESPLEDPAFDGFDLREVDPVSLENLPGAVGGQEHRFVDLDGEGISGVLTAYDAAWFYKPNRGNGRLGPVETVRLAAVARQSGRRPAAVHGPCG